jgi:iron complex outermembrane receptor protein
MMCKYLKSFSIVIMLTLSLQLSDVAYSQQSAGKIAGIHGIVQCDGKPIVGATVRLLELDRITSSGAKGEFLFPDLPNGAYTVFVRCVGHTSGTNKVAVANNTAETSFSLRESAIQSEEVVISASPYARAADQQYQSTESKSMIELQESPGASFAEEISDLPGVEVRYNGSAPARPMIRGLSDNEVLVLEDGLRTGDVSTYDPAHSVPVLPISISQIDVVRGPASIMYGPNAIGGLINVITNTVPTASTNPFSGTVALTGDETSDNYTGYFDGIYSNGGHAFSISAGGLHSQDIRIPTGNYFDGVQSFNLSRMPQSFDHSQRESAGYSYQSDFGMIGVGYEHYQMTYGVPGTPPNPDWMNDPPTTSLIAQNKNMVEMRSLLAVDGDFLRQVKLSANYVDYNHQEYPTQQDSTGVSNPQANHFNKHAVNAALQFQHQRFGQLEGTVGLWINVENLSVEGQQPLGPNSVTTDIAGYIFEEYLLGDDTRLQAAVRYDYNRIHTLPYAASLDSIFQSLDVTRMSNAVTASFGMIQNLTPDIIASLNLARSFRAPTVQELFANGSDAASNTYSIGDPDLSPETCFGIDASLKGRFTNLSFELSPYVNFISNYIYAYLRGDTIDALPVRQFSASDARLMGFEASMMVQPIRNLAMQANADYVNAEDTKNDVPLPFIPPLRGLLRLIYQVVPSDGDIIYSGTFEWRLAASQTRLGVGDTYTAGHGVVNISAGIRFNEGGFVHNFGIHCDNLFNQVYRDNLSVIKDFMPQPGRGVRMNYDLMF